METPEKITVFGASGRTGSEVVTQALEKGYAINAVVRSPDKFLMRHKNLSVFQGDVLQSPDLENTINGSTAVITCLGAKTLGPTQLYSEGVKNITIAMQKAGVKRIICLSASAIEVEPESSPFVRFFIKNILQRILRNSFADLRKMEELLKQSKYLDWTVVRPPSLNYKPLTGKYRIAVNGFLPGQLNISRADVAHFMVNHLNDTATFNSIVKIAN